MNVSSNHFNYCFFPKEVISDARLSSYDKIVYLGILSLTDVNNFTCEFKISDFRKKIGFISKSSISRSIKFLKRLKFIDVKRKQTTAKYTVLNKNHIFGK